MGYAYVGRTPSGLVKIGSTSQIPEERARQWRIELLWSCGLGVNDCGGPLSYDVERYAIEVLSPFRVSSLKREWFNIAPEIAIKAMLDGMAFYGVKSAAAPVA